MQHATPSTTNRAEAERLLGLAEKLLEKRDLSSSRDFAILAQENEPLLDGSDQILAVTDVLLAAERRINNHHDWYAILQIDRRSDDPDLIKKQYRRLALLLHPDKNKFAFSDHAFKLVADAWAVLSDSAKKSLYDGEFTLFSKVDLVAAKNQQHHKLPVRRSPRGSTVHNNNNNNININFSANASGRRKNSEETSNKLMSFWTACPYCYVLYEYPRVYEGCCLRCQNCQRAFHAAMVPSLPPRVPGKEAYYCCWGFFPLGFVIANSEGGKGGFPSWMPPMFQTPQRNVNLNVGGSNAGGDGVVEVSDGTASQEVVVKKKRGRPRKYPLQV